MSYFDQASLVMIPSGYKTSKVYSVKPTDGSGDLAFTRSNDTATRVGPDGLIEKVRTNIALYSEDFANAAWVKSNLTVTSNSVANPLNGAVTADTITGNGSSALHTAQQVITAFGANDTISVYAKKGTNDFIQIYTDFVNSDYANFDLNTGVVGDKGATTGAVTMTSVGNGWYRCSIVTGSALSGNINVCLVTANNASRAETNTLSTTAYVFGAQLETGDIATDYIATTTAAVSVGPVANVPRLDYLNSSCPRLLLEPQRTNRLTYSEQLDNAAWTKQNTSVTANATTSPDGNTNADKLIASATNTFHGIYNVTPTLTGLHTVSFYAKKGEYNFVTAQDQFSARYVASFNLDTGTVSSGTGASIQSVGNGWYRCIVTFDGGGVTVIPTWNPSPTNAAANYLGDGTSGVFVWGAQLEAGAYATSYIPTLGAAVTRGADAASKTGISSLIGQTEGTLFLELDIVAGSPVYHTLMQVYGDIDNRVAIGQDIDSTNVFLYINASGSASYQTTTTPAGHYKIALAYKNGDVAMYINGVSAITSTRSVSFGTALTTLFLNNVNGNEIGIFKDSQALLFKTRLSNADLAALTA